MTYPITYPEPPLVVALKSGKRRTIRLHQIDDLEEDDPGYTRVIYKNGRTVVVAIPFDELLHKWTAGDELAEWLGA